MKNMDKTVSELINADLKHFRRNNEQNYSSELKNYLYETNDKKAALKASLKCLYELRNKVIHRDERHPVLPKATRMLDDILREFWGIKLQ